MSTSSRLRVAFVATTLTVAGLATPAADAATLTTAWQNGAFQLDRHAVVSRSNIVLGAPNTAATQSLPLGNGVAGAAVWAANGFTAQLNRDDTFPDRKSPGQVTIPGLAKLTSAADFAAHLDLYDGVLTETGGGLTARVYLRADKDELVVDVAGADPNSTQTAQGYLWSGRSPQAQASGAIGTLAETWVDNPTGGTGQTFGSLLAVTAGGRNVSATVVDGQTVRTTFNPNANGTFRVVVGVPHWTGGNAQSTASALLGADATASTVDTNHLNWWHDFWTGANLIEANSADGSGQYLENLRTIYLYQEASLNRGQYPGTQAGVADLFAFSKDTQDWVPADYWFWNLRMQLAANLSSGAPALNTSYFSLYTSNLANIQAWTQAHVPGSTGACVPETMRFNGNGYYGGGSAASNASCDSTIAPSYNSMNYSTGAEVSLWIWQTYLQNRSQSFLQSGYPLMKAAAQFLLSIAKTGSDGKLHTTANAHETQWNVTDPVTDILAMQALFPVVISAAQTLNADPALVSQLQAALPKIPPLPRTDAATHKQVLTAADDAGGQDVIAFSTQPAAQLNNGENLDLESTFSYGVIGDNSGSLTDLAKRSYNSRLFQNNADWDYDALYAARLDLASEVKTNLVNNVKKYQLYPNGMASLFGSVGDEFYNEETGIVAASMNEALAQDYDGLLRIAPAWPSDWDGDGTVSVQNNSKVDVQVRGGVPVTVVLEAGGNAAMAVRSPWSGQSVEVIDANTGATVVAPTTAGQFTVNTAQGHKYLIEKTAAPFTQLPFAQVTGTAATSAKHLGPVQIGLDKAVVASSLSATYNNVGVTADNNTNPGNIDGGGASMSATAMANAGARPGGTVSHAGLTFTWPSQAGTGTADNTVSNGQTIALTGSGNTLGFLVTATYGPASGTGTVTYTDGSTQDFTVSSSDWWGGSGDAAITGTYQNRAGNTTFQANAVVYYVGVPLQAGKTAATVRLPAVSGAATAGTPSLHVFAMARG
ncbi:glycosyl hydrolase family 95 catalytic domain-containing protein [Kutzneria sp. NPDC052558]|uniref:glycosyl hydrolase family 95 catalytic domain-containing protein n=1 Tax=Kutzneria sp. NPDC052558 TaxID=3364121 RepID=UPI0037C4F58A